nr:sigma-70 family RNA polymerase sigma factor [Paracoccus saliphilus]
MTQAMGLPRSGHCPNLVGGVRMRNVHGRQEAALNADVSWEALLARANDGDAAAFLCFLTEVTPMLRRLIRARAGGLPADLHEDVLQEVLLAVHLKRQSWQPETPVRPWLYAVARHKIGDACRRRGRAVELPIEDVAHLLVATPGPAPLAVRDAHRMLDMIDQRSAALVRAVKLEGKTTEDVAAGLGLTAGAVRIALHRALKRLAALAERMK